MAQISLASERVLTRRGRPGIWTGVLQVLRTVGARRDRSELRRPGGIQARILPRHELDHIELWTTLLHHSAGGLGGFDRTGFAFNRDARFGERVEKARVKAGVGAGRARLYQRGQADSGDCNQHRQRMSHPFIVAQADAFVAAQNLHIGAPALPRSTEWPKESKSSAR